MKKFIIASSLIAIVVGVILMIGGIWGICFTYKNVVTENIVTPQDSSIPGKPVRGPMTLMAQVDIIRKHTLDTTGGKTFAEMPRQIPKLDELGAPVLDAEGNLVMTANTARDIWMTATTLITALNLGVLTYAFFSVVILFGLFSIWAGIAVYVLERAR